MSDWTPVIVAIEKVEKHPNADALDICTVLGDYPVIVKRDDYKVGDLAGYIPIDSIVPDINQFYFLCPKAYEKYEDEHGVMQQRQSGFKYPEGSVPEKFRIIKAKKIRNVYSQGMLIDIPVQHRDRNGQWFGSCRRAPDCHGYIYYDPKPKGGSLPRGNFYCSSPECNVGQGETYQEYGFKHILQIGDSIVDLIRLKKWEEPEEENLPGLKKSRGANAEKAPQGWSIPHYDVGSIRKYLSCIQENEEIVLTEKLHGSNFSASFDGEKLWVKSRNFYKKKDPDDAWWDIAIRYDLENKLQAFPHMVFFGEMIGQVKGFRYDSTIENGQLLTTVHFFDVWDVKKMRYLDYQDRVDMIKAAGLSSVPELYRGSWINKSHAYAFAEGQSTINSKHIREGTVLVPIRERFESRLNSRLQLKIVGEGYNLQK